jgi:hypothetical protein
MGPLTLDSDKNITAKVPDSVLPPVTSPEVWKKDVTSVIDGFRPISSIQRPFSGGVDRGGLRACVACSKP